MIVQMALSVMADLLVIGSHSKRGIFDVALGGTARQISSRAPCTVLLVSPKA
jgi:nucleotide-binding universal stress UspA family protein